jgi:CheY-like chemotaxis protein
VSGSRHILVVERAGEVRAVLADLLRDLGFTVTLANDHVSMCAILDSNAIDLIVLDASVAEAETPNLTTLAGDRGIRLVMISGRPKMMEAYHDRGDQLLWKPFSRETLKRAIDAAFADDTGGQRRVDPG